MREAFAPSGEIASLDLIAAFLAISRERRTAEVLLARPGGETRFVFRGGELASVSGAESRSPAQILIRSGKMQAETYRRLTVPEGEDRFSVAVSSGVVSRREAGWAQKISAIECLADVLSWTGGSYDLREAPPAAGEEFRLTVDRWILEYFLRSRDRSLVMQKLGPTDTVLAPTERFGEVFPTLGLTADADAVVGLVDGQRSIEEIARKSPSEEFAVLKLLAALLTLGLFRAEWGKEPAPLAAAEPVEAELPSAAERELPSTEPALPPSAPEEEPVPAPEPMPEINLFALTSPGRSPLEAPPEESSAEETAAEESSAEEKPRPAIARFLVVGVICAAVIAAAVYAWRHRSGRGAVVPGSAATVRPAVRPALPPAEAPRTLKPAGAPAPRPETAPRPAESARERSPAPRASSRDWKGIAQQGLRAYRRSGKYRYAIQLEIACETDTLRKAYEGDRAGKEVWIVPYSFRGRSCYRVLWGKFTTRDEALKAKADVPEIFSAGKNRPAVVALGGP